MVNQLRLVFVVACLCASAALTVGPHLLTAITVCIFNGNFTIEQLLVYHQRTLPVLRERVDSPRNPWCYLTQVSALRVDVQRLSQGKRSAEARAQAAETAAQQCQQEVAALRVLTASMLAQPHPGPFHDLEGTESAKPGFTGEASNSVVDTLTQQQGSRVRWLAGPEAVHLQQDSKCNANTMQCQCQG